jgi:DNA processing protein
MDQSASPARLRIAILSLPGIGIAKAPKVIAALEGGPPDSAEAFAEQLSNATTAKKTNDFSRSDIDYAFDRANRIIAESHEAGIQILTADDSILPGEFWEIPKPPFVMYARGGIADLASKLRVAVIGTREPTEWGRTCGQKIAHTLASRGVCVVSGLAIGCDTAGHQGCLEAGGTTAAVMAHGLDQVYPAANRQLAAEILDSGGCLLSEYPIGDDVRPNQYVDRDRLQSALSDAVFVIETDIKGGTMHTVRFAKEQGRMLGCLDHPPDRRSSSKTNGNRRLIEDGQAVPIGDEASLDAFIDEITQKRADRTSPSTGEQSHLFGD